MARINLILSMYPDVNTFLKIFANPGEHDIKRMLLNMITTSFYIYGVAIAMERDDGLGGGECWAFYRISRKPTAEPRPGCRCSRRKYRKDGGF